MRQEVRGGPGAVDGPVLDGLGEDEGLVGPVGCVVFWCEVGEAGNAVGRGDVGDEGDEGCVGALERSVEDVGEEIMAGY